jgi:hypothetical protein
MAITIYNPTTNESITREFTRSQLFECVKDGFTIAIRKVSDSAGRHSIITQWNTKIQSLLTL